MKRKIEITELVVIFLTIMWLSRVSFSQLGILDIIGIPIMLIATILILIKWFKKINPMDKVK